MSYTMEEEPIFLRLSESCPDQDQLSSPELSTKHETTKFTILCWINAILRFIDDFERVMQQLHDKNRQFQKPLYHDRIKNRKFLGGSIEGHIYEDFQVQVLNSERGVEFARRLRSQVKELQKQLQSQAKVEVSGSYAGTPLVPLERTIRVRELLNILSTIDLRRQQHHFPKVHITVPGYRDNITLYEVQSTAHEDLERVEKAIDMFNRRDYQIVR